jgi:peroxiredoxin Q/BCP
VANSVFEQNCRKTRTFTIILFAAAPETFPPRRNADSPQNEAKPCSTFYDIIGTFIMPKELNEGDHAPEITSTTDNGEPFRLSQLKGKNVVLYFYPKADTPGCTKEACAFRDASKKFTKSNTVIVGVSPDTEGDQAKFKAKFDLPFTLLADAEHKAAETYGVWKEKNMYGRKYMGIERTTFVIDPKGVIKKIFPKVKVEGHAEQVLAAID